MNKLYANIHSLPFTSGNTAVALIPEHCLGTACKFSKQLQSRQLERAKSNKISVEISQTLYYDEAMCPTNETKLLNELLYPLCTLLWRILRKVGAGAHVDVRIRMVTCDSGFPEPIRGARTLCKRSCAMNWKVSRQVLKA